ncbi:uncharacterized protein [Setaria viridis]|uniref:uncharacterized protein isoform X2 n=1 Tax=Setaria viridis TaxID=4556 RepID=UPI003B3A2AB5
MRTRKVSTLNKPKKRPIAMSVRLIEAMESGHHDGDRNPKRRRLSDGSCSGDHADWLCALPDELLIAILSRVGDSRAAVSTSALSRRWRRLDPARWIPAFGFSVGDHLPPEYAGTLHRYRNGGGGDDDARWALAQRVAACEDRAMEAYVRGLARFLCTPERYPAARSLRLEFFLTAPPPEDHDGASAAAAGRAMAACLASAFRWRKLDRLAVYAFPRSAAAGGAGAENKQPAHVFPDPEPVQALLTASRLATLHFKNCLAQSGHGYGLLFPALTRLPIEITPRAVKAVFPSTYFGDILLSCRGLVFLRLVLCFVAAARPSTVDLPPAPALQELILEACNFLDVSLASAPRLERLVIERCNMLSSLTVGTAPRLATLVCRGAVPRMYGDGTASLRFVELRAWDGFRRTSEQLASFFLSAAKVEVLKLCFRSPPWFWVHPTAFSSRIENLKKLLIDLPRVWPLHRIKKLLEKLLEAAACLEKLHIHV